jgi:hypothetical protein
LEHRCHGGPEAIVHAGRMHAIPELAVGELHNRALPKTWPGGSPSPPGKLTADLVVMTRRPSLRLVFFFVDISRASAP